MRISAFSHRPKMAGSCESKWEVIFARALRNTTDTFHTLLSRARHRTRCISAQVTTCPSLYVFGALRGLRFSATEFFGLLIVAHTILTVVFGSLAPVLAFFALTTRSYSFMVLMTIVCCALAGALGLRWFLGAIHKVEDDDAELAQELAIDVAPAAPTEGEATLNPRVLAQSPTMRESALRRGKPGKCSAGGSPSTSSSVHRWTGCCARS